MSDTALSPQIIGAVAGGIGVLVTFYIGYRKKLKIGEGTKMGLNLSTDSKCPSCNEPLPTFRRPKNFRQMMWGGWTCEKCGSEFDKWLKPVPPKQ
jgi:ribosomal protein L37AE/L43A